ncbi:MAG: hypothetical protein HY402_00905 [Elusimicrobia bacterium]|nr:hypothetical protein [Elusimicrobiota bacterium]
MAARVHRVVLGVCGSIAAYKACEVIRRLREKGVQVRCVLTPGAQRFITPLSLSALCGHLVYQDLYDPSVWEMAHLSLAQWADRTVVAPATAEILARTAGGHAQGLLDALILATKPPVIFCPAMDEQMWKNPATRKNVSCLRSLGHRIWGPQKGPLASGKRGWGRMIAPEEIVARLLKIAV